jgi:hypothetical protein
MPGAVLARSRWALALVIGTALTLAADFASQAIPMVLLGLPLKGFTFALVGALKLVLGLPALAVGLRLARLRFPDVGLVAQDWRTESLIGGSVAVFFAAAQFLIIIPITGGAERSDIVVETARIGHSMAGVAGFAILAWTGVFVEEILFRGLIFTSLRALFGGSRTALSIAVLLTVVAFAAGHGYQGWAGVIDTGLYGGLLLTLLYVWRGRLTACIVAHACWNTLAPIGIYLLY